MANDVVRPVAFRESYAAVGREVSGMVCPLPWLCICISSSWQRSGQWTVGSGVGTVRDLEWGRGVLGAMAQQGGGGGTQLLRAGKRGQMPPVAANRAWQPVASRRAFPSNPSLPRQASLPPSSTAHPLPVISSSPSSLFLLLSSSFVLHHLHPHHTSLFPPSNPPAHPSFFFQHSIFQSPT